MSAAVLLFSLPSAATVWVERRMPDCVSAEAVAEVEQAAAGLRALLAACEEDCRSLPDEPGEDLPPPYELPPVALRIACFVLEVQAFIC